MFPSVLFLIETTRMAAGPAELREGTRDTRTPKEPLPDPAGAGHTLSEAVDSAISLLTAGSRGTRTFFKVGKSETIAGCMKHVKP